MAKKASERRFDKLVGELLELRTNHPERFRLVWRNYFRGWAQEVQRRAAAHRQDVADGPIRSIFGVLDKAQRLARGIGAQAEPEVAESLVHLRHDRGQGLRRDGHPCLVHQRRLPQRRAAAREVRWEPITRLSEGYARQASARRQRAQADPEVAGVDADLVGALRLPATEARAIETIWMRSPRALMCLWRF